MKKLALPFLFSALLSVSLSAQTPEKKQEDKKDTTSANSKSGTNSKDSLKKATGPKETRMAITQKGVPSTKVKDNSASKTASTQSQPKEEKPSGQPK